MSGVSYIIAEAGVNHNGDPALAHKLIDAAAEAGADAVKFQTFSADAVATEAAPKAAYQTETTGAGENQRAMLARLELSKPAHHDLLAHCRRSGLEFLSTPFDLESLAFLTDELDLPTLKIASGEITNRPLLEAAAHSGKKLILSTGMCMLGDVEAALAVLENVAGGLKGRVSLLHCVSQYPAPAEDVNLKAMATLRRAFGLPVGLSDHTAGTAVAIAAAALGAAIIEKHFTLDRTLPGPDHRASLEPGELKEMVTGIRTVEAAMGDGRKAPQPSELETRDVARRSLVAGRAITAGDAFSEDNIAVMRPGGGISPMRLPEVLGRTAPRDFDPGEMIEV